MRINRGVIFGLLLFLGNGLYAQRTTYLLRGNVKDASTGKFLAGAAIALDSRKTGVVSDSLGNYSLRLPEDEYVVRITHVGYKPFRLYVKFDKNTVIDAVLEDVTRQLEEVIVSSVATRKDILTPSLGVSLLSMKGIKKIPAMMGEVDVLRSLQTLPGVSSVGEGANGINIRGGAVDQNLVFIDNTPIFNPTHLFGLFSIFASDGIRELELYKGGIPARFGGRTASVLDIKMLDPNLEKFKMSGGVGPISNRALLEIPIIKNKLSILSTARLSFNDFWFKLFAPDNLKNTRANFYDVANKVFYKPNAKNTIALSTYFSQDFYRVDSLFSLENVIAKQTDFRYGHTNFSLKWNKYINEKSSFEVVGVYSNYKTLTESPDSLNRIDLRNSIQYQNLKFNYDYALNERHKTNFGFNAVRYDLNPGVLNKDIVSKISSLELAKEQSMELSLFADDEFKVNNKLTLQLGLRYTQFLNLGPSQVRKYQEGEPRSSVTLLSSEQKDGIVKSYGGFEPRLTAVYVLNPVTSLKFGYNRMQQFLQIISNNTTPLPTSRWKIADENILPQNSDFLSLGYFKTWNDNVWEASIESYFRDTRNVIDYVSGANLQLNQTLETQLLSGRGRSYGAELMISKKKGELTGWFSYTYARSFQQTNGQYAEQRINNGNWYASNYDKPHTVNIVLNAQPDKHNSFSFIFAYNTGRPFSSPTGTYTLDGQQLPLYLKRNNDRIPDYHRLDFSWTITNPSMKEKRWEGSWIFTVYNVYGRSNPYSVFFTNGKDGTKVYQLSVFASPLVSLAYNFKFK
ncbi:TonB-dependent receptor-like protein [Arcicella aurantiaca]|uniref:TonB-dependent receptor-like protein n=1 Tax=Arcicella aurantiaca TaxID=591202 RepID=A0A316DWF4_9BACT|nr:TonB-dependent receptor [Arcicella aurantiaca]PWK22136.1 TonB-dependent receptor-like protein [Arcicella aurantiaca]